MSDTYIGEDGHTYVVSHIPDKVIGFGGLFPDAISSGGEGISDHEQLNGLLGGNTSGHYHLTQEEHELIASGAVGVSKHEELPDLQGGTNGQHYHLTQAERNRLMDYPAISDISPEVNHNELNGLQGGTNGQYYHLTQAERNKLTAAGFGADKHEELPDLQGGTSGEHYHLTQAEHDKLGEYPAYEDLNITSAHNDLNGLQGGTHGQYYHLTQAERNKLNDYPEYEELNITSAHNELTGLQGGQSGQYYHLTLAERTKLSGYPTYSEPKHEELSDLQGGSNGEHYHLTQEEHDKLTDEDFGKAKHEELPDLQGGSDGQHYHLTQAQHTKLTASDFGVTDHEELSGLLGGKYNEHYHFTEDEWHRLKKVLNLLYPGGDETYPVFPKIDPYAGMPAANPPAWVKMNFPTGYSAFEGVHKMYYGEMPYSNSSTTGLLVCMYKGTDTTTKYFMSTENLIDWTYRNKQNVTASSTVTFGQNIGAYQYINGVDSTNMKNRLYFLGYPTSAKYAQYLYSLNNIVNETTLSNFNTTSWLACCHSPDIHYSATVGKGTYLFISQSGVVARCQWSSATALKWRTSEKISIGMTVNPGCAAWVPAGWFVVAGPDGTATSADGVTWEKHPDAPHNLRDLTWRTDFENPCLFAWREEDRKFYASADGVTWETGGNLPSEEELISIAAIDYNPDLKWYCAVGASSNDGTSRYAYFSYDMNSWRRTQVVAEVNPAIKMGSVIWAGGNIKKYVLMPTEGQYFYTFDPNDWEDNNS